MNFKLFTFVLIALILATPALGALNEYEAGAAATKYQHTGEIATAYGPYTYLNHPYYCVEFDTNGSVTGVVIIDGISGELADMETARKISYAHNLLREINADSINSLVQDSTDFKNLAKEMKNLSDEIENNQLTTSPYLNSSTKQQMKDISKVVIKMEMSMTKLATTLDNQIVLERATLNGNKSYENAVKIMNGYNETARNMDELIPILREAESIMEEDMGITELEVYNDELKRAEQDLQKSVDWDISSMESRANEIPGFSLLISICSILIVGVLIKRRK